MIGKYWRKCEIRAIFGLTCYSYKLNTFHILTIIHISLGRPWKTYPSGHSAMDRTHKSRTVKRTG